MLKWTKFYLLFKGLFERSDATGDSWKCVDGQTYGLQIVCHSVHVSVTANANAKFWGMGTADVGHTNERRRSNGCTDGIRNFGWSVLRTGLFIFFIFSFGCKEGTILSLKKSFLPNRCTWRNWSTAGTNLINLATAVRYWWFGTIPSPEAYRIQRQNWDKKLTCGWKATTKGLIFLFQINPHRGEYFWLFIFHLRREDTFCLWKPTLMQY